MKNFKKILLTLTVLAVLVGCLAVTAWASEASADYTGSLATLSDKVSAAEFATGDTKISVTFEVFDYLKDYPVDPASEGYAEVIARVDALGMSGARYLASRIDSSADLISYGVSAKKLKAFVSAYAVSDTAEGYDAFKAEIDAVIAAYDKAFADNKNELENKTPFNEYNNAVFFERDFEDNLTNGLTPNAGGNNLDLYTDPTGNKCYRIEMKTKAHSYSAIQGLGSNDPGVVIEFDITTFSALPALIKIESFSTKETSDGSTVFPHILYIKNGVFTQSYYGDLASDVIVPEQWTHVTIVLDRATCEADYYIDYVFVARAKTCGASVYYKSFTNFRFGADAESGEYEIDNIRVYSGTGIRTEGRFDGMTEEELFLYYSSYLDNENLNLKLSAYEFASDYIEKFYDAENETYLTEDAELRAAVDAYLAFDKEGALNQVKRDNLDQVLAAAAKLSAIKRAPETLNDRKAAIEGFDKLLAKVGENVLINAEYNEAIRLVDEGRRHCTEEEDIISFIDLMDRFATSTKVQSLVSLYNKATEMLNSEEYSIPIELAIDENSPFTDFKAAYELYLAGEEVVENAIREDNAKSIIARVGYLTVIPEEEWEERFDYMDMFAVIVRATIREGRFDPYYPGLQDAIEQFEPIDAYFYGKLQEKHIAELQGVLDSFAVAESYVEKMGYVAYIERYLDRNDIDYSNEDIARIYTVFETYRDEMEMQEEDYASVLEQNTVLFINSVNMLATCTSYVETKAAYEVASVYYYAMNVGTAEAQAAIAIFDGVTESLKMLEEHSFLFIEQTVALGLAETARGKFEALVECAKYVPTIEFAIDGVEEAYGVYAEKLQEYNDMITAPNKEIEASVSVVASTRANCSSPALVAIFIKKILGL